MDEQTVLWGQDAEDSLNEMGLGYYIQYCKEQNEVKLSVSYMKDGKKITFDTKYGKKSELANYMKFYRQQTHLNIPEDLELIFDAFDN